MTNVIQPFHLLVIALAGWLNRHQQAVIDYLIDENRVLNPQTFKITPKIGFSKPTKQRLTMPISENKLV